MEYTLAFKSVNTVAVFRSRPRRESKISTEGFAASSASIFESWVVVSMNLDQAIALNIRRQGCQPTLRIRPALLVLAVSARAHFRLRGVLSLLTCPC